MFSGMHMHGAGVVLEGSLDSHALEPRLELPVNVGGCAGGRGRKLGNLPWLGN